MEMSTQRKRVVVLASSVACLSGTLPVLTQRHGKFAVAVAIFILAVAIYAIVEFVKLKRQES